jgi:hypothetical protein
MTNKNNIVNILKDRGINSHYLNYSKNIFTQNGEDGIIEKIFFDLKITEGNVIEFGAWDGIYLSNVYRLWKYKGFNSLLIEGDSESAKKLMEQTSNYKNVESIEAYVSPVRSNINSLDSIISKSKFDFNDDNFNLLSIDIDGLDYRVWDSLKNYNPKIVICETNWKYGENDIEDENGCSLKKLTKLAKSKGYELVCHNLNGIYVRRDLFNILNIKNDIKDLYLDIDNIIMLQKLDEEGNLTSENIRYLTKEYTELINNEKVNTDTK